MPYRTESSRAVFLLLVLFSVGLAQQTQSADLIINWNGTGAFHDLTYPQIIDSMLKHPEDRDTASRAFRLGTVYLLSGDPDRAMPCFAGSPLRDAALSPFAWEGLGDCCVKLKRFDSAVGCYEQVMAMPLPPRYRATIYRKIHDIVLNDTLRIRTDSLRRQYCRWWKAHRPPSLDPVCSRIDTLVKLGEWSQVNHLVITTLTALDDSSQAAVITSIDEGNPPVTALTTSCFFLLSRIATEYRRYGLAERMLGDAHERKDFVKVIGKQKYLKIQGKLLFSEGKNEEAVESLSLYIHRYGYEAEIGFLIARAWKMLDNLDSAALWYDRFIAHSPRYRGMAEILWRRAWIEVERGDPDSAAQFFRKIYQINPRSSHADEAILRHALCSYEEHKYDSALYQLSFLESRHGASAILPAALFWKGKSWLGLDSLEAARDAFGEAITVDPFDYYAYRSRMILAELHDSVPAASPFDSESDTAGTIRLLDSLCPPSGRAMSFEDSINLRRAIVSATIGRIPDAETFFEQVEQAMKGSPSLVFRMARLYRSVGAITQGVRAGRRILARLPAEERGRLPLPARTLLFPKPWAETVKTEALKWNLDPSFTYAVIRQESVFDPEVVSPAGAIGLMQIMPATGKTIARELGEPFSIESLYSPEVNIRYGTYYLYKLSKEFDNSREFTLAGYNGGPPKAKEWQERGRDKDPDLMIEGIVFSETRNYVKKVMANFWMYSQIMH